MTPQYRNVPIPDAPQFPLTDQPAPQVAWVKIADLLIDSRYQRPLAKGNETAIRNIARDFRWSRFSPLLVAPIEGGKYALIDGQHRAHAAALCGIESVPSMIVLVPCSEQAGAFIDINTRRIAVSGHSIYRAALTAGVDWAVRAEAAVTAAGCALMTYNANTKTKKPAQIYAVALIRKLIEAGHDAAVTAGLRALVEYDPESVANFDSALLTPWLWAIASDERFQTADLVGHLRAHRPWITIENAKRYAENNGEASAPCQRKAFVLLIKSQMSEASA